MILKKCELNCFECPYPDCIADDTASLHIDKALVKEKNPKSEYMAKYYQLNKERIKARCLAYYYANRETIAQKKKERKLESRSS